MTPIYRSLPLTGFLAFAVIAPAFAQTTPPSPEAEKPDAAATPSEADKKREAVKKAAIKKTVLKRLGNETPADAKPIAPSAVKVAPPKASLEPKDDWYLMPRLTLVLGYAPLVGAVSPGLALRKSIEAESPLTNNTYVQFGIDLPSNPTMVVVRPSFEAMPLALFRVQVAYWGMFLTGVDLNGGHSLTVEDRDSPTDKATWEARSGEGGSRIAHRFTFNAQLRASAADLIAVIIETEAAAWYVPSKPGDGGFMFNSLYDNLVKVGRADGTIMNRALLLAYAWRSNRGASLLVGLVNEYVKSFAANHERDRFGAAVIFNVGEEIDEIQRMQVALLAGVNLLDKNYQYSPFFQLVIRMHWDVFL